MRLIDADALINNYEMNSNRHDKSELCGVSYKDFFDAVICDISHAPTVDAVEVVRCKDCKYHMFAHCFRFAWDELKERIVGDDDYCSWGERKDENDKRR